MKKWTDIVYDVLTKQPKNTKIYEVIKLLPGELPVIDLDYPQAVVSKNLTRLPFPSSHCVEIIKSKRVLCYLLRSVWFYRL